MAKPNFWLWLAFAFRILQMLKSLVGDDSNDDTKEVIENNNSKKTKI